MTWPIPYICSHASIDVVVAEEVFEAVHEGCGVGKLDSSWKVGLVCLQCDGDCVDSFPEYK